MFLVFTKDLFSKKSLLSEFGHPGSLRDIAAAVPEVILDQHGSHGGRRTERHPSPSASRISDGAGVVAFRSGARWITFLRATGTQASIPFHQDGSTSGRLVK